MSPTPPRQQHILFTGEAKSELARNIIDALFVFVGVLSKDGVLLEASTASLEKAGVTLDQVRGTYLWDSYWWNYSPDLQVQLRSACEQAAQGATRRFDTLLRMGDDHQVAIDFQVAPLRRRNGAVSHFVAALLRVWPAVAAQLLMHSELAVSDVAKRVGFHSASHFTLQFRQWFLVTPTQYRSARATK